MVTVVITNIYIILKVKLPQFITSVEVGLPQQLKSL